MGNNIAFPLQPTADADEAPTNFPHPAQSAFLRGQLIKTMAIKELHFITGNRNKLAEVQSIIGGVIPLKNQSLDLVEIQGTIEDISKDKCRRAAEKV